MLTNCLAACTNLCSTVSQLFEPQVQKNRRFHVLQPTFLFTLETPLRLSRNMLHGSKDNFNACQTPRSTYLSIFNSFRVIRCISQCVTPKIAILPHFCFPWGRPWGNHAKCCMDGKRIRCLQIVSLYVPMYLQQFPRYSNRKCQKTPFSRTAAHIVSPGDAPATITQYVAWVERQFNACQTPRSMYLSIFNSFRVIRCLSQCVSPIIAIFYHIFVSPGDGPGAITLNVVCMEREFDAYKLPRCMCPSNYNRFWDRARYWWKIVIFS